jgi:acetyl esterase/lipase
MKKPIRRIAYVCGLLFVVGSCVFGQSPSQINSDSATFDTDGTAHVTRIIPMPSTISLEAQKWLKDMRPQSGGPNDLAKMRAGVDAWRKRDTAEALQLYPVTVETSTSAGVRTDVITPQAIPAENKNRVLINLHGGGFIVDSGSLIEGIPIANLTKTKVVTVYYRLAPENPFPAAVDDVVAVYKDLLKTYQPHNIGIFGTSAGAILTGEVAIKLKQSGLPLPAALGMFSTLADFSRPSDSRQLFTLTGFSGDLKPQDPNRPPDELYPAKADRRDPVLSPLFADLHGMPPSLLVTSTRDLLLSDTSMFHRALLRAGVDAKLAVFEALPHAFWYNFQLPETKEALEMMAKFFDEKVGR